MCLFVHMTANCRQVSYLCWYRLLYQQATEPQLGSGNICLTEKEGKNFGIDESAWKESTLDLNRVSPEIKITLFFSSVNDKHFFLQVVFLQDLGG